MMTRALRLLHLLAGLALVVGASPSWAAPPAQAPHSAPAAPRIERSLGPRIAPESGESGKRVERLGIGPNGEVRSSERSQAGERSLHRIASETRVAIVETRAPERRAIQAPPEKIAKLPEAAVEKKSAVATIPARDWAKAPAIVEHIAPGAVFATSDLHGHYEPSFKLFESNNLLRGSLDKPGAVEWTGGNATLVIVGDVINKGDGSVKLVDMIRQLQKSADKQGGKVIVTLGNHEADFIHDPHSSRSLRDGSDGKFGFGHELKSEGTAPETVASGADPEGRGQWIRELPFAAKVGDYFFIHSGDTRGMDRNELSSTIQRAVADGGFGHGELIDEEHRSVLGAGDWKLTASEAKANAKKLGVKAIVMGHISNALGLPGEMGRSHDGALIKLDTGIGNDSGPARLLRIGAKGGVKQVDASKTRTKLRRGGR